MMVSDSPRRKLYALLVGIDDYAGNVSSLQGCVNDIRQIETYLRDRLNHQTYELQSLTLLNESATREAIIAGFQTHLQQAGPDDIALFYYSGHGSQEAAPPEFWPIEPDRMNETLVCWDSRTESGKDLADKELAYLIHQLSQRNPQIVLVLDCCHSGSGTRDAIPVGVRHSPADQRQRHLQEYLFGSDESYWRGLVARDRAPAQATLSESGWTLPVGRHILLAGCHDAELASEYIGKGEQRGAFSYFLLDTLQKTNGSLSYRDLFKRASSLVRGQIKDQSPQLEAVDAADLDLPFLGVKGEGAIAPRPLHYTLSSNQEGVWVIDGGAVHGLPHMLSEPLILAIYLSGTPATDMRQLSAAIGEAQVTEVFSSYSTVQFTQAPESLSADQVFSAVVVSWPISRVGVVFEAEAAAVQLLRETLAANAQSALYIQEVAAREQAQFRVCLEGETWLITQALDSRPLVEPIQGRSPASAQIILQRLEHMARWMTMLELSSPVTGLLPADAVDMQLSYQGQAIADPIVRLEYDGEGNTPTFELKLINQTDQRLYCALFDLTEEYSVSAPFFGAGGQWIEPRAEVMATAVISRKLTTRIPTNVPKRLWEAGVTEYQDVLKLIVSTDEFDPQLLTQEKLDKPAPAVTRSLDKPTRSTLNRLMKHITTRGIAEEEEVEQVDEWMTSQITLVTVRPQVGVKLSQNAQALGQGVTVQGHPNFKAKARLVSVAVATRGIEQRPLPPLLRDQTQPFSFTRSRGVDGGLSALELSEVENFEQVSPEAPLTLEVGMPLAEEEQVLPVAFDGEFYIPLGFGRHRQGKTEIELQRLPQPLVNRRSVTGAIQIYFQKVVYKKLGKTLSERLGVSFDYPILALNEFQGEKLTAIANPTLIQERVAQASTIVIFIHGVFGDTASMVPVVNLAEMEHQFLSQVYDLVLSYDYESINTSIKDHAEKLKQRLKRVGLAAGHGKTVHLVAHSMGGLISRYFIENLSGNEMVQHLIMLGTPNGGSPWPEVQRGITAAVAFLINGLSLAAPPIRLLGFVLERIEKIDVTLDEMEPGSDFLEGLWGNEDPQIPYSVVVGNTSLIPQDEKATLREKLRRKLAQGVELPFMGQANDIAVTVESIKAVPTTRSPQPVFEEVACNHLVYFHDPAGVKGLERAIARALNGFGERENDSPKLVSEQESEQSAEEPQRVRPVTKGRFLPFIVILVCLGMVITVGVTLSQHNQPNQNIEQKSQFPDVMEIKLG